ncbi:MAG: Flp pilus assembly complex ATPase component TadA [Planctomycetes bacterium]|nr:Flp pilus assembly complex ATPase component TadA [Planctomycetota bacterium]
MSILDRLRSLQNKAEETAQGEPPEVPAETEQVPVEETEPLSEEEAMRPESLISDLVEYCLMLGASDLFLTSTQDDVSISLRHLGVMRHVARMPLEVGTRCLAFVHTASGMRYGVKKHPQDGRWILHDLKGMSVDMRVSTIPTLFGESLALRLIRRDSELGKLNRLGLLQSQLASMQGLLMSPSGLILITGPTGSGKTTTTYACLHALNDGRRKIHTLEDPVEYSVPGLVQTQIELDRGAGFAEMLRAILRQGPDVIMIGEIRDPETAETAVQAANSGQLVLATMHAPTSSAAIHAMLGLGISPYMLCSSLLGTVGQRLVRVLNPETRIAVDLSMAPHTFDEVREFLEPGEGETVYSTPGASAKNEAYWYRGQTAVFEILLTSPKIRQLIRDMQPASTLAQAAIDEGMIDLRRATLLKIAKGITSFDEMQSEIPSGTMWVDS